MTELATENHFKTGLEPPWSTIPCISTNLPILKTSSWASYKPRLRKLPRWIIILKIDMLKDTTNQLRLPQRHSPLYHRSTTQISGHLAQDKQEIALMRGVCASSTLITFSFTEQACTHFSTTIIPVRMPYLTF